MYGWDEEQTDRQSALYLKNTIFKTIEMGTDVLKGLSKGLK